MKFVIKICGVTRPEDAAFAAGEGAAAIGLNFWRGSKRFVEDAQARDILAAIPAGVLRVGVFVNAHPLVVTETLAELGLDMVQLHGEEKANAWDDIAPNRGPQAGLSVWGGRRIVRAVRVYDESSLKDAQAWDPAFFIYDAHTPSFGGAGVKAPWDLIARGARRPFLLAGGLTPENVAEAIQAVRPDGVDVASGVESSPGVKDHALMTAFIAKARAAAAEIGAEI
jgi:phosphoribosylanthranilate isomerase